MDGAGWVRLIKGWDEDGKREDGPAGKKGLTHTEDYGLQNFVYRRRRPFHPKRLRDLLSELFLVMEIPAQEGHDGHEHGATKHGEATKKASNKQMRTLRFVGYFRAQSSRPRTSRDSCFHIPCLGNIH